MTLGKIASKEYVVGITHKTGCVLCAQNCGLVAEVEYNRHDKQCDRYFDMYKLRTIFIPPL